VNEFRPCPKPSHSRRVKKRRDRSKFSKMVRDEIKQKYNNECAMCGKLAFHVHHVQPRARSGRNVITNGLLLCNDDHKRVHADEKLLKYWIEEFKKLYGRNFYKDKEDLIFEYKTEQFKELDEEVQRWVKFNAPFDLS
jgi:hypothetical protein